MEFGGKRGKGIISKADDDQRFELNYFGASINLNPEGQI